MSNFFHRKPETVKDVCEAMRDHFLKNLSNAEFVTDINFTFYFKGERYFDKDWASVYISIGNNNVYRHGLIKDEVSSIANAFSPIFKIEKTFVMYDLEKTHEWIEVSFMYRFEGFEELQEDLATCRLMSFLKDDGRHFVSNTLKVVS